jgi:hypothetical protein
MLFAFPFHRWYVPDYVGWNLQGKYSLMMNNDASIDWIMQGMNEIS